MHKKRTLRKESSWNLYLKLRVYGSRSYAE